MAQDGTTAGGSSYTIDNVTFPVGRTKLQSIFDAIRSTNIGNTAPDLVAGQFWIDNNTPSTTVWTLYLYDGTDNISFATIDTINNTVNFLDSTFDLINDTTPQLGGTLDANGNNIDMGTNLITDTKVGQWDTAYSWGDHSTQGYLTSETDSQTLSFSSPNLSISNGNSVDLSALDTGILNVSEDLTPDLGGNLNLNSNDITGTGNVNITGTITSSGDITTSGVLNSIAPTRHSIRPSLNLDFANSKALDPRITFTRASNATYYDGYTTVKAEENLVQYSEDISVFGKSGTNATLNTTTAPDGTTTADKLISNGVATARPRMYYIYNTQSGKNYTHSIFAKASEVSWIKLRNDIAGAFGGAFFNLSTGSVGTVDSGYTASIVDAGNGWYRCIVTHTASITGENLIGVTLAEGDNDVSWSSISSGDGVFLWGAQVEERDTVSAYTKTTGTAITKYQPALQTAGNNVARFDHNPTTGESLGLLIEESRTNVATYSEDFSNANWGKTRCTIDSNKGIAPDGTQTADLIVSDGTSGTKIIYDASIITPTASSTWTVSVYAKTIGSVSTLQIEFGSGSNNGKANFDLSTGTVIFNTPSGTVSDATGSITDVGNDWYRCSLTVTHSASWSGTTNIGFYDTSASTTTFGSILIWGAQLEQGSFPTSYIKTEGSQVTRSVDLAKIYNADIDFFNKQQYSILAETKLLTDADGFYTSYSIPSTSGVGTAYWGYVYYSNASNNIQSYIKTGGSITIGGLTISGFTDQTSFRKQISAFETDNSRGASKGTLTTADTSGRLPTEEIDFIGLGHYGASGNSLNGHMKLFRFYPTRLTDNEITDLSEE